MTMQMSHKIIRIRTPCLGRHFGLLSCYLLDQQAYFLNTYRNPHHSSMFPSNLHKRGTNKPRRLREKVRLYTPESVCFLQKFSWQNFTDTVPHRGTFGHIQTMTTTASLFMTRPCV